MAVLTRWRPAVRPAVWLGLVAMAGAALFDLQRRVGMASTRDAHYLRIAAERVARLDEPYYVAGADHKGPLWLGFYRFAYWVAPSQEHYWFVIAGLLLAVAGVTALALRSILRRWASPMVADLAAIAAFALLILGPEQYSYVLYARNVVTMLLVVAVAVAASLSRDDAGDHYPKLLLIGACVGAATQTMPTAGLAGMVILALTATRVVRPVSFVWAAMSAAVTFATAPGWYVLRGHGQDFFDQWWTYNRIYSDATGRTNADILTHGIREIGSYYADHLALAAIVVAFVAVVAVRWRTLTPGERGVRAAVLAWWAAELVGLMAAQRFFADYWVSPLLPTVLMAGLAVYDARAFEIPRRAIVRAAGVGLMVLLVAAVVAPRAGDGVAAATAFDGFASAERERVAEQAPSMLVHRAVVHAYSDADDWIYTWSGSGFPTVIYDRPSALRYSPRRWMTGYVVQASTSPDNILPNTAENVAADLEATPPTVVIEFLDEPLPETSTLGFWVERRMSPVGNLVATDGNIDVTVWLPKGADLVPPTLYTPVSFPILAPAACTIVTGSLEGPATFSVSDGADRTIELRVGSDQVDSGHVTDEGYVTATTAEFDGAGDFSLIVGDDYVVLVIDDTVVGGHTVWAEWLAISGAVENLHSGPLPWCNQ